MRLLLALVLYAAPAAAEGEAKLALIAPEPGCEAPPLVPATALRDVQDAAAPPFRLALLACTREGPPKRPLRRT